VSWDDFEKMLIERGWSPEEAHAERMLQEHGWLGDCDGDITT
jgi:cytochrome oxidase assembly protein ShyY1